MPNDKLIEFARSIGAWIGNSARRQKDWITLRLRGIHDRGFRNVWKTWTRARKALVFAGLAFLVFGVVTIGMDVIRGNSWIHDLSLICPSVLCFCSAYYEQRTGDENSLDLIKDEPQLIASFRDQLRSGPEDSEKAVLEYLRDLRAERSLEYQIYYTREQWLWIIWTAFFAGAVLSLTSSSVIVRVWSPVVTGVLAWVIADRRDKGLETSLSALNARHRITVRLTDESESPRVKLLGFGWRLTREGGRLADPEHEKGFRFPKDAKVWTVWIWLALIMVGNLSRLEQGNKKRDPLPSTSASDSEPKSKTQ